MFSWWMQSHSMEFSKPINFMLFISEFSSSTRKIVDEIFIFAEVTIFCIKRRSSFMFLNILSGVKWGTSLVPTWTIDFFGRC